jgi:hypothetical protein
VIVLVASLGAGVRASSILNSAIWTSTSVHGHRSFAGRLAMIPPATCGAILAASDIRANRLRLKSWGCGFPRQTFGYLVRERYAVELVVVGGSWATPSQAAAWTAYNAVTVAEVDRRYGRGSINGTLKEAAALSLQRSQERLRSRQQGPNARPAPPSS